MEFKRTTGERREAMHTLSAMLNHRGGRVLFGVEPNRNVRGQQVSDKTLEDVAQEIKEIDPPVFPSIERVPIRGGFEVLVVTVTQGQNRPYSYKGRAYKRVGNTSQPMSRDEYNRMLYWNACTARFDGRIESPRAGQLPISMRPRLSERWKKASGAAEWKIPRRVIRPSCCADLD